LGHAQIQFVLFHLDESRKKTLPLNEIIREIVRVFGKKNILNLRFKVFVYRPQTTRNLVANAKKTKTLTDSDSFGMLCALLQTVHQNFVLLVIVTLLFSFDFRFLRWLLSFRLFGKSAEYFRGGSE
jgi:hypothetical protein